MKLRTLGRLALDGGPDAGFTRPKPLLLLAYLALEGARNRPHLAELFFGQAHDPPGSLRTTVRRLRQEVPDALVVDGELLRTTLDCDATALLTRLDAGRPEETPDGYPAAFLAGVSVPDLGVELEEWIYATREYLAGRVRAALLVQAEQAAGRGAFEQAGGLAERAAWLPGAAEPEPEDYRRLGQLLAAAQSPQLGRLRQAARDYGVQLDTESGAARAALRRPDAAPPAPGLPLRGTSFVGRDVECGELLRALERPEVRLLTLVGPGGIGKTRLALEVARTLQSEQEVVFVSLEAVTTLGTLPVTIASAVGLSLAVEQPTFEALLSALRPRRLLLVLDSAEHLLAGVPWLSRLLAGCPDLRLLVTSREALGTEEEWVLTIGGLTVPADATPLPDARRVEAVALFVQRARRARLDFDLTPEDLPAALRVCRLVGGSPLGIELAAAWVKLMGVPEIAQETQRSLDFLEASQPGVSQRHASVRAVFDQVWARLTDEEQRVLAQLSIFQGGFTREAAGRVAGATALTLATLAGKSLIRVGTPGRYEIHVLLLQFARERLAGQADGAEQAARAHGLYFLELCRQAARDIREMRDEKRWLERIEQDLDNVRSALDRWLKAGDAETALRCVALLRNFWARSGRMREAREWFRRALSMGVVVSDTVREIALGLAGEQALYLHDYDDARRLLQAALSLGETLGSVFPLRLLHLGSVEWYAGNPELARHHFETAIPLFREEGSPQGVAAALNNLGGVLAEMGDLQGALTTYEAALAAKQESGGDTETVLLGIGDLQLRLGHLEAAEDHLLQALRGLVERGYNHELPTALQALAQLALRRQEHAAAALLLGSAEAQREALDTLLTPAEQSELEREFAPLFATLPAAERAAAWARGRAMTIEQAVALATERAERTRQAGSA